MAIRELVFFFARLCGAGRNVSYRHDLGVKSLSKRSDPYLDPPTMLDVNGCARTDLDQKKSLSALISGDYGLSRTLLYISMMAKAGLKPALLI